MKFFDAFAGIGGFHKGITEAIPEAECMGFSEIDKYASSVYEKNFSEVKNYGDIRKMDELPAGTELLCGGFPCQAFSIAGKRKGFEDTRGTLFFELARLLRKSKPKYFLFENVKGLLSHDDCKTIKTILATLGQLNYDIQGQVMDSQDWGLAQHRERIFIAGHLRGERRREVFPLRNNGKQTNSCNQIGVIGKDSEATRVYSTEGISRTIKNGGGMGAKTGLYQVQAVLTPDRPTKRQNGRRFKEPGEPSFTLTAQDRHGILLPKIAPTLTGGAHSGGLHSDTLPIEHMGRIRRLTPLECERLQGFPDQWTKYGKEGEPISDSQRYKMLGNAVSVNVVKAIMGQMK